MRRRKEHVISQAKGDAQPRRLVALSVSAELVGDPAGPGWQHERLLSWCASGWERGTEGSYRVWNCTHADPARWWRAVEWGAKRGGVTWLVADRAVRVASLLGLWGMIDEGRIQWDGWQRSAGGRSGAGRDVRPVPVGDETGDGLPGRHDAHGVRPLPSLLPAPASDQRDEAVRQPLQADGVVIDDPPTILRLRLPGRPGRLWLLDSRNWGIESVGDSLSAADEARWLAAVMRRMVDELASRGWGGLKATAGSQSLAIWRHSYLTHPVIAHGDSDILDLEARAYVGGRCECGRLGPVEGPLFMVDRRSAYAAACAELDVPVRVKGYYDGGIQGLVRDPERAQRCCAEAGVSGDEPAYPYLARDGVRYPVGNRSVVLAGPELRDAVERGAVQRLGRCVEYECAPALRGYAEAVHGARCEYDRRGDAELSAWSKKLLVGLPGKLGQRCAEWVPMPGVYPPAPWYSWWGINTSHEVYRLRALGGAVQRQQKGEWTYDSVPAVACWVLSHARLALLQAIRVCGWDECLYWDTDSLLLTEAGWSRLQASPSGIGGRLGQWRLVRQVSRAVIHGPKYYIHDGVVTCAGMPRADTAPTRLLDRYWYRQTFGVALGEGHSPQAGRRLRTYSRAPQYLLGRVGDGGKVHPFIVNDF